MAVHIKYLNKLFCTTDVPHGFLQIKSYAYILFGGFTELKFFKHFDSTFLRFCCFQWFSAELTGLGSD